MTDRRESREPVRVELILDDFLTIPRRKHTVIIEIDRDDWNSMEPYERKEYVEDRQRTWLEEQFDLSYDVLGSDNFNDVAPEE